MKPKSLLVFGLVAALAAPAVAAAQSPAADPTTRCDQAKQSVDQSLEEIADHGQAHLDEFSDIAGKVETFYQGPAQAEGIQVSDYQALSGAIQAKQQQAEQAVAQLRTDELRCNVPLEATLGRLRSDIATMSRSLKEYRASVRNLIVSIRTAANARRNTPTPEPVSTARGLP